MNTQSSLALVCLDVNLHHEIFLSPMIAIFILSKLIFYII